MDDAATTPARPDASAAAGGVAAPGPSSDGAADAPAAVAVEAVAADEVEEPEPSRITEPARVVRIGHMLGALREELDGLEGDEAGLERLAQIYDRSVEGLAEVLTGPLRDELEAFATTFGVDADPTTGELRVAHAQLVGWLEGLLRGLQAALASQGQGQQLAALQQQLGARAGGGAVASDQAGAPVEGVGQYL